MVMNTDKRDTPAPFRSSKLCLRSPPRSGSLSDLPSLAMEEVVQETEKISETTRKLAGAEDIYRQSKKRKAVDDAECHGIDFAALEAIARDLEKLTKQHVNTKVEIKQAVSLLLKFVRGMMANKGGTKRTATIGPRQNTASVATQTSREQPPKRKPKANSTSSQASGEKPQPLPQRAKGTTTVVRPPQTPSEKTGDWKVVKKKTRPPKRETVVTVTAPLQYAEIVKAVRSKVDIDKVGATVLSMRKRGENLAITVKGGAPEAEALSTAISTATGLHTGVQTRSAFIHVKDLDKETTRDEVQQEIAKALSVTSMDVIQVTSLRPAFDETQNATVKLPSELAKAAAKRNRIRIGWVMCRVRPREPDKRCYRCGETGHFANNCKGPDKSKCCFRCGEEGHVQRLCPHEIDRGPGASRNIRR